MEESKSSGRRQLLMAWAVLFPLVEREENLPFSYSVVKQKRLSARGARSSLPVGGNQVWELPLEIFPTPISFTNFSQFIASIWFMTLKSLNWES